MRKLMILLLSLFVAACAASGEPLNRTDELAVYEKHATGAESWVRYTSVRNWWAVGYNSAVFELDRSRHYLLNLVGACDLNLRSSSTLKLVSSRRNVISEFDRVVVGGQACQIQSIRRVDLESVQAELAEMENDLPDGHGSVDVEVDDQSSGGM